jgi:hypothetical protein
MIFYEIINIISIKPLFTQIFLIKELLGSIINYLTATSQTFDKPELPAGPLIVKVTT